MKKKLIIIGSIILALAILAGGAYAFIVFTNPWHVNDLTGFSSEHPASGDIAPMRLNAAGEFVVLQFTDTHLATDRGPDARTLEMIEYWTARVEPDLVVITGDMLEGRAARRLLRVDRIAALRGLASIFQRLNQPWTFTPGNNDHEFMGSARDVAALLLFHCNYILLANQAGLPGAVYFTLPLYCEDDELAHQLIFLDSLGRYDIMQPQQAAWLREVLRADTQASVFFHYNTPMFYEAGFHFRGREGDTAIDEVVRAADNVGIVSVGHAHPDQNFLELLDGTLLHIVRASGYRRGDRNPGAAIITIRPHAEQLYAIDEIIF